MILFLIINWNYKFRDSSTQEETIKLDLFSTNMEEETIQDEEEEEKKNKEKMNQVFDILNNDEDN